MLTDVDVLVEFRERGKAFDSMTGFDVGYLFICGMNVWISQSWHLSVPPSIQQWFKYFFENCIFWLTSSALPFLHCTHTNFPYWIILILVLYILLDLLFTPFDQSISGKTTLTTLSLIKKVVHVRMYTFAENSKGSHLTVNILTM